MKIPEQAKSVFTGEIFSVYQWPQAMFDGSPATFEMIKRADTTEIIAVHDGKVWYAEQEQPVKGVYQSFFGGRIEAGETPEQGALRELQEESGFVASELELIYQNMPLNKMDWTNYIFVAKNCAPTAVQNPDPGEKISLKSCTFEELIEKILNREIKTSPHFIINMYEAVYRYPERLQKFKEQLGLV